MQTTEYFNGQGWDDNFVLAAGGGASSSLSSSLPARSNSGVVWLEEQIRKLRELDSSNSVFSFPASMEPIRTFSTSSFFSCERMMSGVIDRTTSDEIGNKMQDDDFPPLNAAAAPAMTQSENEFFPSPSSSSCSSPATVVMEPSAAVADAASPSKKRGRKAAAATKKKIASSASITKNPFKAEDNITTITATFSFNQVVDLRALAHHLIGGNVIYDPYSKALATAGGVAKKSFQNQACVEVNLGEGRRVNASVFSNGTVKLTGCKKERECKLAADNLLTRIKQSPGNIIALPALLSYSSLEIVMVKCDFDFGFPLCLDTVVTLLQQNNLDFTFEPERYCAIKVHVPLAGRPKPVTACVFHTGKIFVTGHIRLDEVQTAFDTVAAPIQQNSQLVRGTGKPSVATVCPPSSSSSSSSSKKKRAAPEPDEDDDSNSNDSDDDSDDEDFGPRRRRRAAPARKPAAAAAKKQTSKTSSSPSSSSSSPKKRGRKPKAVENDAQEAAKIAAVKAAAALISVIEPPTKRQAVSYSLRAPPSFALGCGPQASAANAPPAFQSTLAA